MGCACLKRIFEAIFNWFGNGKRTTSEANVRVNTRGLMQKSCEVESAVGVIIRKEGVGDVNLLSV